jgi:hypothetical protein
MHSTKIYSISGKQARDMTETIELTFALDRNFKNTTLNYMDQHWKFLVQFDDTKNISMNFDKFVDEVMTAFEIHTQILAVPAELEKKKGKKKTWVIFCPC